jgi:L-asparaginase
MKRKVIVITTGGTIEKTYDELDGSLSNRGSHLKEILKRLRLPYVSIHHQDLLYKDSLEMTERDRQMILMAVENVLDQNIPIVILHGTDTMEVTAKLLYEQITNPNSPIIMTGAMRPFGFENSDAIQNFTEALFATVHIKPGIYISMHGEIHKLPNVRKNRDRGTFENFKLTA